MIWIRMGDGDNYHQFNSVEEGAYYVGTRLGEWNGKFAWFESDMSLYPVFQGRNYVSLYWGDGDAQWDRALSTTERELFEDELRRVYEEAN